MQQQQQNQEEEEDGLLAIGLDSDSELETSTDEKETEVKVPRDFQSEENFQQQLRDWKPSVEVGELYKTLPLPLNNPSKPDSQKILHAIEELYFLKRYEDASRVVNLALEGELVDDFRETLERYRGRILVRQGRS